MAPGPRARRPRPGVEHPRGPPHGQSLPVTIPPDPDTAGLPAPAQEGFPQVRWAPATPPNHPEGHPQGTGCTCLPGRDLRSRAGGPDPGAGPGDTGERRGSPAQPAQAWTTHCGPSVRLPQLQAESRNCLSPSPPPGRQGLCAGCTPGCSGPLKQGQRGNTDGAVRPNEPSWREGGASLTPTSHGSHGSFLVGRRGPTVTRAARRSLQRRALWQEHAASCLNHMMDRMEERFKKTPENRETTG